MYNALFTKTVEHYNYNVNNETSNVLQHAWFQQQDKFHTTIEQKTRSN